MSIEWLSEKLSEQGIELSNTQKEQFQKYYQLLVEWNKKMNLTTLFLLVAAACLAVTIGTAAGNFVIMLILAFSI